MLILGLMNWDEAAREAMAYVFVCLCLFVCVSVVLPHGHHVFLWLAMEVSTICDTNVTCHVDRAFLTLLYAWSSIRKTLFSSENPADSLMSI